MKILVAYFSCTGNTEAVALQAAEILGADVYEIEPQMTYTSEDLNYNNTQSRASREHNDADARPDIAGSVEAIEQYDIVFLGYPIWWGEAPRIINTFLESYDFSGKTIVPFCTSQSSGIGSSDTDLHKLCSDSSTWLQGRRFSSNTSAEDTKAWIDSLGLNNTTE